MFDTCDSTILIFTLLFDTVTRSAHILRLLVIVDSADAAIKGVSAAAAAVAFAHRG